MSENPSDLPALPERLPALAVLGITSPDQDDWARLRGLQYARLSESNWLRLSSHSIAAAVVVWVYASTVGLTALGVWLVALMGTLYLCHKCDSQLAGAETRKLTRTEFRNRSISITLLSLAWCVPLTLFAQQGTISDLLVLWTAISVMIVGLVLVVAAAPLGTVIFTVLTGLSVVFSSLVFGEFKAAAIAGFFIVVVLFGTVASARTYLTARIAEAGMAEKGEVVSLLLREFEDNKADWLWQIDTNRRIRSVSPRFSFALGKEPDALEGQPFLQLIAGDAWESGSFPPSLHELADKLKRRESFSNLIVKVVIGGQNRWWELSGTPILDERQTYLGFRGVGSDVTEQRESSDKIAYLARYDTLTGLPNRLMLNEALSDAMDYAKKWRTRCAFLMLDLDRFKAVNDSLGHLVGDQMLAQVSKRLKQLMGENAMCGRLGGDEFGIVIRDASDKRKVEELARNVIASLSMPYDISNNTLYVGASVGSAIGPRDGKTVEEIMRNADLALYRAKDEGGGEHCQYEPTLHAHAEERRKLEFSLRRALERDEFELHYQPVVDANDETVVSFEALVRWNSPEHGYVRPDKFISLAEDTRLIVPIGEWVLATACAEAVNWPPHVRVAVNVSGEQLIEPNFATTVVQALSDSGLPANRLEVEVTESIFLRDANVVRSALEQVMALGCTVALDDFGTGYSSLGYLRKLSFSTIKVDRSFVQGAAQGSAESLAIIRAVVAMADSLEMSTTAEGVENAEEAEMVRGLGCKKIQGYYFGRPMPVDEVQQVFARKGEVRARIA
ncbi:putative bifunctional diguanylate cyclase/phosphodiesterase [Pontixanthobacter aquaemixtae]|uniref:EAL domain-containing protein n=1 Tax=Pontixanthobacter aquaemixtae TaxID=1958940 RepID=A0A844ZRF4_9SPHN|nr:EAL domain-containing protein [Pontixanthobacter aquaemixtae]MXO89670.1 EAL domain-containing protein [Pontixanthobacter aquaemixtae]